MLLAQASSAVNEGLGHAGQAAGYNTSLTITEIVVNIINVILSLTGIAFVGLLIYAGILYLMAGGAEDNVKKAKRLISSSIIGIIIIVASYAIAQYVFQALGAITPAA
jgi:ABC-type enterochelin transport system permease subunit